MTTKPKPYGGPFLRRLLADFNKLVEASPDIPDRDVDWWAAYECAPCDPWREIADAAGHYAIARDEGRVSADLYAKELRDRWKAAGAMRPGGRFD